MAGGPHWIWPCPNNTSLVFGPWIYIILDKLWFSITVLLSFIVRVCRFSLSMHCRLSFFKMLTALFFEFISVFVNVQRWCNFFWDFCPSYMKKERWVQTCFINLWREILCNLSISLSSSFLTLFACILEFFLPWSLVLTCHGEVFSFVTSMSFRTSLLKTQKSQWILVRDVASNGVIPNQRPFLPSSLLSSGATGRSLCFYWGSSAIFRHISWVFEHILILHF